MKELNTNPSPTPPDTLSKLIRLAIKDARRLNKDTYWPNYTQYHTPHSECSYYPDEQTAELPTTTCHICVAGAVIAGTLNGDPSIEIRPEDYSFWTAELEALDRIRVGDYLGAYFYFRGYYLSKDMETALTKLADRFQPFHSEFNGWKEFTIHLNSLEELAQLLAQEGL